MPITLLSTPKLMERKAHDKRIREFYSRFEESTQKTFRSFCRRWVQFCEKTNCDILDMGAKTGEQFLEAERLRHKNPGNNVEIAFTQFKRLCSIRGCPKLNEFEYCYLHAVVSTAKRDSAQAERSWPVDEDNKQMARNIVTAAVLQKVLRVCADMPNRLTAARAKALVLANIQTGESHSCCSYGRAASRDSACAKCIHLSLMSLLQRVHFKLSRQLQRPCALGPPGVRLISP